MRIGMNNLLYEFLDFDNLKEILDSQIFNWNPTKDIPDIYPNKNEKTRIHFSKHPIYRLHVWSF